MKKIDIWMRLCVFAITLSLVLPVNLFAAGEKKIDAKITHKPVDSYYPGFRIQLDSNIEDPAGIRTARCYFKAKDEEQYLFVETRPMPDNMYHAELPAPWVGSKAINYYFLAVNEKKDIIKSQVFEMTEEETEEAGEWKNAREQNKAGEELDKWRDDIEKKLREKYKEKVKKAQRVSDQKKIEVKTDAQTAPKEAKGFNDNISISTAGPGAQYSTMAATTISAGGGGSSLLLVAAGLAAAGGAAAAGGSGGGSSNSGSDLPGGTGEVKVTLQWSNCDDLDLWVTDPCGNRIFFNNRTAACQGRTGSLDLDANVSSCSSSPAENIFWTSAPAGTYTVQVNLFGKNTTGSTAYTVTTIVGGTRQTFTGALSTSGATDTVTSFTK